MRWVTHQVGALGAGLLLHLPLAGLAACVVGGILPDVFDQKLAGLFRNRQKAVNNIHRGFTHWPGLWLGLLLAVCVFLPAGPYGAARAVCFGAAVGGLSHVVLDMMTPQGIPLLPFTRKNRFSLHLCKTGSLGEYAFCAAMIAAMAVFLRGDISDQAEAIMRLVFRA